MPAVDADPDSLRLRRIRRDVPVPGGVVAAEVFIPARLAKPSTALVCFPGGGMSRRYFDLQGADANGEFSFAEHAADRGFVVVLIDHLGVGESTVSVDPWTLNPTVVADANAAATTSILDELGGDLTVFAVGHSMGGLLAVTQQARHRQFSGLVLLGTSACGLREALTEEELAALDGGTLSDTVIRELAEKRHGAPIVAFPVPGLEETAAASPARKALTAARSNMLAVCGLTSMLTGYMRREFEAVDVPVFLGLGERDIAGPIHAIPADFPASKDISLFVLPGAGHNTSAAPNRAELWDRVLAWVRHQNESAAQSRAVRNRQTVRTILAAVSSLDFDPYLAALADDIVYEAPYYAGFGERHGKASIEAMFDAMGERFSALRYDIVDEFATRDPDLVIVECRGDNVVINSEQHYRNHYLMFIEFDDAGLICRWREFSNPDVYRREAEPSSA